METTFFFFFFIVLYLSERILLCYLQFIAGNNDCQSMVWFMGQIMRLQAAPHSPPATLQSGFSMFTTVSGTNTINNLIFFFLTNYYFPLDAIWVSQRWCLWDKSVGTKNIFCLEHRYMYGCSYLSTWASRSSSLWEHWVASSEDTFSARAWLPSSPVPERDVA